MEERLPDAEEVVGSIPTAPTRESPYAVGAFSLLGVRVTTSAGSGMHTSCTPPARLRLNGQGRWLRWRRKLEWTGKVGLIGAVSDSRDRNHTVTASMGERFTLYRMPRSVLPYKKEVGGSNPSTPTRESPMLVGICGSPRVDNSESDLRVQ